MRNQDALKYLGLAGQILFTLLACVFAGIYLDKCLHTKAVFAVVFSLLGLVGIFYKIYKDLSKP